MKIVIDDLFRFIFAFNFHKFAVRLNSFQQISPVLLTRFAKASKLTTSIDIVLIIYYISFGQNKPTIVVQSGEIRLYLFTSLWLLFLIIRHNNRVPGIQLWNWALSIVGRKVAKNK